MAQRFASRAVVILALCTTCADASCTDTTAVLACVNAFSTAVVNVDAAIRCPALATYQGCISGWAKTCTIAAVRDPLVTTFNTAKTSQCAGLCAGQAVCINQAATTTLTPWDSSASSGSGTSLDSMYSSSFKTDSSSASIQKSSSGSSFGSTASGSSGSFMQIWQWLLLLACCCACLAGGAGGALMGKKKPKKKNTKKPTPAPAPVAQPEALPVLEPLMMPITTNSMALPQYSMVAAPQYTPSYTPSMTAFASPAAYSYAAPQMQAYPMMQAPATTAYATAGYPAGATI